MVKNSAKNVHLLFESSTMWTLKLKITLKHDVKLLQKARRTLKKQIQLDIYMYNFEKIYFHSVNNVWYISGKVTRYREFLLSD